MNCELRRNVLATGNVRLLGVDGTACGGGAWHPLGYAVQNSGLRPINRKGQHVRDVSSPRRQHRQPVNPQSHPCALRKTIFQSGQQPLVDRHLGKMRASPRFEVGLKPLTLDGRVGEFVVAVREFESFDKDLESLGQRWVTGPYPRERGL